MKPLQTIPLQPIIDALKTKRYKEAEALSIEVLRSNRLLAQAWVYLGEALMHQGYGKAARRVFDRAWMLDPQSAWVHAVHKAVKDVSDGPERASINELLEVKKVTVAAAILVYNNERSIERCLTQLIGAVDEIVVIDSNSTDRTVEIVKQFPEAKLVNVEWREDFAEKRNRGLEHVESDWVLWVDSDEYLVAEDKHAVRDIAGIFDELEIPPVLLIWQLNQMDGTLSDEFTQTRMFPTRRGLLYRGRVHEQIVLEGQGVFEGESYRQSVRIRLLHDGYEPSIVKDEKKLERNLRLLEQMVAEEPDNPGWLLYYGRESMAYGNVDKAIELFLAAEAKAADYPRFGRTLDVQMFLVKIYMSRKELDLAEQACRRALSKAPNFPDAIYYLAQIQMRQAVQLLQSSEKSLRSIKEQFQTYRGPTPADTQIPQWKTDVAIADLALISGKKQDALAILRQVLERNPSLEAVRNKLQKLEK
ncbi:TPR domain-containing glycosyltransferase [Paenibacillus radicis (ex Xue et al. 2023)]|uniref:Tetratricopeptide repeat protein n=1 Tax=Paenibacillus radicis (ex Xue et al. 2023) TaxID=2972489 RepID=A0ABT1YR02_9BACL|nr:TPR domain-containing glycosyltransferase [Paenibacillus radicis (ex Xue et al. 2023)]MCR8635612.1 tetratricopeptide repeat protein [Paenibacillus radicis (ex Xue et al. 2023)]